MSNKKNTWWFLFVFMCCTVQYGFTQQSQKQFADSVENTFQQYTGKERVIKIAESIRFTDHNHETFFPYLPELYNYVEKYPDLELLNTIRLGHVNLLASQYNRVDGTELLYEILQDGETLSVQDSLSVYTFLMAFYEGVGAYSKVWEAFETRESVLLRHPTDDSFNSHFQKISNADLASIYLRSGDLSKAIDHFKLYISDLENKNEPFYSAGAWNNLGLTYLKAIEPDSAIYSFEKALIDWGLYLKSSNNPSQQSKAIVDLFYGNIGEAYNQKGMYSRAIPLLQKHVQTSRTIIYPSGIIDGLNEIAVSYIGLGEPIRALKVLDSAAQTLQLYTNIGGYSKNMKTRIIALENSNRPQEALNLLRRQIVFEDSIALIGDQARTAILEIEYEVGKKNSEISRQKINLLEAKAKDEQQKRIQWTFTIGLILMSVIVILLVISRILRIKRVRQLAEKNRLIGEQNIVIELALTEKETLLKEIHHRVKNNLQLVSGMLELQAVRIDDKKVRDNLKDGQKRLKSMSLIHELLYTGDNLGSIDFKEYVSKLTNDIAIAFGDKNKKIDFHFEIDNIRFGVNTAVPLGLIITELITNTYRHAFINRRKGNIHVNLKEKENGDFQLTISDDGIGMPKEFDFKKAASLGMRLVNGLTRQLDGSLDILNGKGTTVIINFKDINEHESG